MKIVVTGAAGMLGKDVVEILSKEKNVALFPTDISLLPHPNAVKLDLTDKENTLKALNKIGPDIIIHCAALADVDRCEKEPALAFKVHVDATKHLAEYSNEKAKLLYISTDSVYFDNSKDRFSETDRTNPANEYARTKLLGEKIALQLNKNTLILRTNIYGFHRPPRLSSFFFDGALAKLLNNENISGYKNIFFNPLYTKQLACIIKILMTKKDSGIINAGAKEKISKYDFLLKFTEVFGLNKAAIKGIDDKFATNRPKNTTMNIEKLEAIIGNAPTIDEGLRELKIDCPDHLGYNTRT